MTPEHSHSLGASIVTSVVTAFVALWPGEAAVHYIEKLISVLILAAVAEMGRRLGGKLIEKFRAFRRP